jgi:hypothetical protein
MEEQAAEQPGDPIEAVFLPLALHLKLQADAE